jgi:hypothetical protein
MWYNRKLPMLEEQLEKELQKGKEPAGEGKSAAYSMW